MGMLGPFVYVPQLKLWVYPYKTYMRCSSEVV